MKELAQLIKDGHLGNAQVVYFDSEGNWYLHKNSKIVSEKKVSEIVSSKPTETEESEDGGEGKKGKKK